MKMTDESSLCLRYQRKYFCLDCLNHGTEMKNRYKTSKAKLAKKWTRFKIREVKGMYNMKRFSAKYG